MTGVMVFKGIKPGIRPGDLTISTDKNGDATFTAILSTSFNMIPIWLKIAHEHRKAAKQAKQEIDRLWSADLDSRGDLLLAEMLPSIQAFVACATAIDAFYSLLKPHAKLSHAEILSWQANGTSRSSQVYTTLHRIYKFPNDFGRDLKVMLKEIASSRDKAVHPSHDLRPAMQRPDIPVGLDWRFCEYSYERCEDCYKKTMNLFLYAHSTGSNIPELDTEIETIISALIEFGLISHKT